jgi:hypothetical protein
LSTGRCHSWDDEPKYCLLTLSQRTRPGDGDENKDKKEEKKGGHVDTFGEKKEDKKDEKKGK